MLTGVGGPAGPRETRGDGGERNVRRWEDGGAVTAPPGLTVVVACVEAEETIGECLRSFSAALAPVDGEILLCHPEGAEPDLPHDPPEIRRVAVAGDVLVPHLWGAGLREARGDAVAFSTGHFRVGPGWATALLAALADGWAGAGGPIALAPGTTVLDRAIFLLRYSSFTSPATAGPVAEIPGDNAAYGRAWLDLYPEAREDGFWEVEFHERVRREGGELVLVPEAEARYGRSYRLATILRQRYRHGAAFGAFRIRRGDSPWRLVLLAPGVPLVMTARILRRQISTAGPIMRAVVAAPLVIAMATAWAAGEAVGALSTSGTESASSSGDRR